MDNKDKTHYRKDISGLSFGRWVVDSFSHKIGSKSMWNCVCDCGEKRTIYVGHLNSGASKSCGCLRSEILKSKKKHGLSGSRLQVIHTHMKQRCSNDKCKEFKYYGKRGIKVCEQWEQFENFAIWATRSGYKENLLIDRINNNKDYEPSNCRWVNSSIQNSNRRKMSRNSSGFIGVTGHGNNWRSRVDYEGKVWNIGSFESKKEAAKRRDLFILENNLPHTLNFNEEV